MDTSAYLKRIGVAEPSLSIDTTLLKLLQRRHLTSIPFENLDIHWGKTIVPDIGRFFEKIVIYRRGGFCYELNGLFNELLLGLGFAARLVSARVFNGKGYGPEFDHAAIIVTLGEIDFLADVGFGDFTAEPLKIVEDLVQADRAGEFVVRRYDDRYLEVAKRDGDKWRSQYIFTDNVRELSEFAEMCHFHQTSPDSHFTKGRLCSIMTETGRRTLTDNKYLITDNGRSHERTVGSAAEFDKLLDDEFGIRWIQ
ncbi:MAG TPA: arylamine N-acetyltransferase [Pyrinomonadaceae bacterium]|nr:arylamine N-acetyltransferase [Pyrinomonadaceae bacterium]HMP64633.1 arylamine N-acetyltransferase [Pyrinomonadaceae bacterium]